MYTQCPDCHTAFRVTAQVLQQASGRVRCGGCGNAFNAIHFLSEDAPARKPKSTTTRKSETPESAADYKAKSKALLDALDALAGTEDVRIEDTGIEWRVLDDDDEDSDQAVENDVRYQDSGMIRQLEDDSLEDTASQTSLDLPAPSDTADETELRYDDNTPLPEEDEDEHQEHVARPPARRNTDAQTDIPADDPGLAARQVELDIGGAEDWAALLEDNDEAAGDRRSIAEPAYRERGGSQDDESLPELGAEDAFDDDNYAAAAADRGDFAIEVEEELAAIHSELTASAATLSPDPARPVASDVSARVDALNLSDFETAVDTDEDESPPLDIVLDADSFPEPFADEDTGEILLVAEEDLEQPEVFDDEPDTRIWVDGGDDSLEIETLDEDTEEDHDTAKVELETSRASDAKTAGDAPLYLATDDSDDGDDDDTEFDDDFGDELSADEEANIVEKLRESTGAFQKQIEAAQRALQNGDVALYSETIAAEQKAKSEEAGEPAETDADRFEQALIFEDVEDAGELESLPDDDEQEDSEEIVLATATEDEPVDLLSQTMIRAGIDPSRLDSEYGETIIMEGDFVRGALDEDYGNTDQKPVAAFEEPESLVDTYMLNKGKSGRRRGDRAGAGLIFSVIVLALLLTAQYLHLSRDTLATYGAFNQTLGPVYRALGKPVTPQWNVKGWRFESTRGSTDASGQVLTIFSNIGNASDQPLPYPLVHVSLTDRWEEIIGSKVLEPGEYLAGDLDPRVPVAPGDRFSAVIAIESPADAATGFKLNVCYRVSPGKVRCATEDFKN